MQRVELRTFVRDISLVPTHEISDATLDSFLDEGFNRIIRRHEWSWLHVAIEDIVPGVSPFDLTGLTNPVFKIYNLARKDSPELALVRTTRADVIHLIRGRFRSGNPRYYYTEGDLMTLYPTPDGTITYELSYFEFPAWAAGDTAEPLPMPSSHHSILADWAIHRVWEQQEDFDRSDAYRGRFEAGVTELLYDNNTRDVSRPKIHGEVVSAVRGNANMPWLDGV